MTFKDGFTGFEVIIVLSLIRSSWSSPVLCVTGLRKVYPYYFTFTTFTKGRWVGEKILEVFAREFRAHPAEEYERCIRAGTLTVNYQKVDVDYRLRHNDLLANVVHRYVNAPPEAAGRVRTPIPLLPFASCN